MRLVTPADYRSEKMGSSEGLNRARSRWFGFVGTIRKDVLDALGWANDSNWAAFLRRRADDPEVQQIYRDTKEQSELIGFWVTWHLLGGFDQMEKQGWNRATLFRKIKRFRDHYDMHPDEYEFPWLKIDFDRAWSDMVKAELGDMSGKTPGK